MFLSLFAIAMKLTLKYASSELSLTIKQSKLYLMFMCPYIVSILINDDQQDATIF
jgi:hypothetical protein